MLISVSIALRVELHIWLIMSVFFRVDNFCVRKIKQFDIFYLCDRAAENLHPVNVLLQVHIRADADVNVNCKAVIAVVYFEVNVQDS